MKRTTFVIIGLLLIFTGTILSAKKEMKQKEVSLVVHKKQKQHWE